LIITAAVVLALVAGCSLSLTTKDTSLKITIDPLTPRATIADNGK